MRGRKPKPTHLKLLEGNPGKRKINRREPRPKGGKLLPPAWLRKEAKAEWRRVLAAMPPGLYTQADRQLLVQYCQNVARVAEIEKIIREQGLTFVTDNGYIAQRPEVGMLNRLQTQIRQTCSELGLSPTSRARLEMPEPADDDPTEDFLFGKRPARRSSS
jgi:P27 family predicted phage terminase small subunit